jgi:hypothetical protein
MYIVRVMKSGHSVRVSLPRDVQRHLGLRVGDHLALELRQGPVCVVGKLDPARLRMLGGDAAPSRSD